MNEKIIIERMNKIKKMIGNLIEQGRLKEAEESIKDYEEVIRDDIEIYSMKAVILIIQNEFDKAEMLLKEGLIINSEDFDLNYNLAYLYEQKKQFSYAVQYYKKALKHCKDENISKNINDIIEKIYLEHNLETLKEKKKMVFFVRQGMDNFLSDIINGLFNEYEIKKIIVTDYKQIEQGMHWADICWFEWCDELIIYGSQLPIAKEKKIICRLHRYEAFTDYPKNVNWDNVNKVIFVSEHIKDVVTSKINLPYDKCEIIYNGINLNKFKYYERKIGFNLAWIGYLNLRKNPMLIIQYFNELVKKDRRYKLFIAGSFQDETLYYYIKDIIDRLGLNNNINFDGFIPNDKMNEWLKDKNYIVTGSISEGHPVGVMEAMASGLKPVIHYFPGSEKFYPKEYIYNDLFTFIKIIDDKNYDSEEYREFIKENYSLEKQMYSINNLIKSINEEKLYTNNINLKNKNLKISYVMPVYNGEKFIKKALESILKQKVKPFEIIIIDDNSTDNSYSILKEYAKKHYNIKILRNKKNLGEAKSTAKLIDMARGDFIKILHQDDGLYEEYSTVISNIENIEKYSFIVNDFTYITDNGISNNYLKSIWDRFNINPNELKREVLQKVLVILGNYLGGPSNVLFNRKKLLKVNYLEHIDDSRKYRGLYGQDYYTFLKLMNIDKPLIVFKDLSYRYEHSRNITSRYCATMRRVTGLHKILLQFEHILNENEKKAAYENLLGKAIYSINSCKDKEEKKNMIKYVLENYKYLSEEQEGTLIQKLK